ncbi:glycosyltransferase [Candidatus Aminicenantes bacterium AC-708-M15]|nr:glycosyltransferase [SCandidatus Aminicenantes bacterium Aminicenantia_JdfR_composite]MCP2597248.1 glycosyltransferase [Candidatus Aminicenantes bacterium AC-335-G13]MCP2604199.1 glycosyltransferase [Candidatus Aminicenantes bacterium AC-708-M15]MCP2618738.1 glycosyltransferase [Candidatus Aminicenantes bacterium AC-335-A11]
MNIFILISLLLLFLNLINNLRIIPKPEPLKKDKNNLPLISVLIPARNEERNIRRCLSSLLKQDYPNLEIIVLDDNSWDRTAQIVLEFCNKYSNLRLIKGKELPENWTGKNWACHQLAQEAKGEWFVFTDADTRHSSNSISSAYAIAVKNRSPFLSYLPGLINKKISEALLMPIIHFAFLVLYPLRLLTKSKDPRLAVAIGPFILIKRDFYYKIGGHESVKKEILDDLAIAKRAKAFGGKTILADGSDVMQVRFYHGFREIWKGFSKNAYGAFIDCPQIIIPFLILIYFLFVYPYFSFIRGLRGGEFISISAIQVIIISLIRVILSIRCKTNMLLGLFHPIAVIIWILIVLNSLRMWVIKKGIEWKERYIPID